MEAEVSAADNGGRGAMIRWKCLGVVKGSLFQLSCDVSSSICQQSSGTVQCRLTEHSSAGCGAQKKECVTLKNYTHQFAPDSQFAGSFTPTAALS
eukprot:4261365-Amphidinium_carterae.1